MSDLLDRSTPTLHREPVKCSAELPHGLIAPPAEVLTRVERERERYEADAFQRGLARLVCDWTLQYWFDALGYEVLYRPTPNGPEVVAVGFEEIRAYRRARSPEEQVGLKIWLPY